MQKGDLVKRCNSEDEIVGLIIYKHPTKGVVFVLWPDNEKSWESCSKLFLISSAEEYDEL